MKLEIEKFLDHIDEWKFKLQDKLKGMTPEERTAFWKQIRDDARARGLRVVEPVDPEEPVKKPTKRVRRTG